MRARQLRHRQRKPPPSLTIVYQRLLAHYGPQGWWPVLEFAGSNPTTTGSLRGYHPGDYSFPRNQHECFEICLGAILTQNTAWINAEKALLRLKALHVLEPHQLIKLDPVTLAETIRPSGYYFVKTRKLREFTAFYIQLSGRRPTRAELLGVWGIGPETADSMLLYAFHQIEMVVDAYTRRILAHLGLVSERASYDRLKALCTAELPTELQVYQEFHALMVEHAKQCYARPPYGQDQLFD